MESKMRNVKELLPHCNLDAQLKHSKEGQEALSQMLLTCYAIFNTYGKEPEFLKDMKNAYIELLGYYPAKDIIDSFLQHIYTSDEMPTVRKIKAIADRIAQSNHLIKPTGKYINV